MSAIRAGLRLLLWKTRARICVYCGRRLTKRTFTIDHVEPRSKRLGQPSVHSPANLVLACHPCNQAKADSDGPPRRRTIETLRPSRAEEGSRR